MKNIHQIKSNYIVTDIQLGIIYAHQYNIATGKFYIYSDGMNVGIVDKYDICNNDMHYNEWFDAGKPFIDQSNFIFVK